MTIAEKILRAVAQLVRHGGDNIFTRKNIRDLLGVDRDIWVASYSPIFQGMRIDHPGGAPDVRKEYKGIFRQVEHGKHTLTEHGRNIIREMIPLVTWRDAVIRAMHRYANNHNTKKITRQVLINEELDMIVSDIGYQGATPGQTLIRVLQELRDEELIYFIGDGIYLLADTPIHIDTEDLPDEVIDILIKKEKLRIGIILTDDKQAIARQRKGQSRIRSLTLANYGNQCAFCDVDDISFLVASHIARWADEPDARGDLSNVICMCRLHDALFEQGYFSISDDYSVIKKSGIKSNFINRMLNVTFEFRTPKLYFPLKKYLKKHRERNGFV